MAKDPQAQVRQRLERERTAAIDQIRVMRPAPATDGPARAHAGAAPGSGVRHAGTGATRLVAGAKRARLVIKRARTPTGKPLSDDCSAPDSWTRCDERAQPSPGRLIRSA